MLANPVAVGLQDQDAFLSMPLALGQRPVVRDLILSWEHRLLVWPAKGVIYGRQGEPVGSLCKDGYVRLGSRGGAGCLYAHRMIWETVNGPIPAGLYVDHRNGRKSDNRISNLDVVTPSENVLRAIARGCVPLGSAKSDSKLTEDLVCEIRASKLSNGKLAAQIGVDRSTVRLARVGTTWRHVVCRGRRAVGPRRRQGRSS